MTMKFDKQGPRASFLRNRDGGVLVIGALALPVVIGMAALVAEYGHALVSRVENQRIADLSSYAGAIAYSRNQSESEMQGAVDRIALLNGLSANEVTASLVASPRNAEALAVSVNVTTHKNLLLAPVIGSQSGLNISALAMAEVGVAAAPAGGCILAIDPAGSGITLSGGTSLQADDCEVSSNAAVAVPCGTQIRTPKLNYNSAAVPSQPCNGIVSPNGGGATLNKAATPDPLAEHPGVATLTGRLSTVAAMSAPVAPAAPASVAGTNLNFEGGWNASAIGRVQSAASSLGCSASWTQPKWTFTCPPSVKTVNVGTFTVGGGISLDFALTSGTDVTYNFSGSITTAATMNFGPGTYNIVGNVATAGTTTFGAHTLNVGGTFSLTGTNTFASGTYRLAKGLTTGGGSTSTFGSGTFEFGQNTANCSGNRRVSICNTSTLRIGGPSKFRLSSGIFNSGGSTLTMGSGTANSYRIGPSSIGHALELGGGSTTIFADATGNGGLVEHGNGNAANGADITHDAGLFELVGNLNAGGGGSCLALPAAANHDIAGNFNGAGAIILGSGVWAVDGYLHLGANGGGSANCNGRNVSVFGEDVSIVMSGKSVPNNGTCANRAFCAAAGYSGIVLKSPTAGPFHHLAVIGPQSASVTHGALFAAGAGGSQVSGAFYFPKGPIVMSGGASAAAVDQGCLTMIGTTITLSGGTSAVSQCDGLTVGGSESSGRVSLVR